MRLALQLNSELGADVRVRGGWHWLAAAWRGDYVDASSRRTDVDSEGVGRAYRRGSQVAEVLPTLLWKVEGAACMGIVGS